jgi:integrase
MLALGRVYKIAARHPILSYHVSFAINWRFPPAGYPPPKTLASSRTLGQEKRTFWPANQRNWVEQSGKSHHKAVIVTPDQAFKILVALPESERVLTLVIAATGLRISEALGLQWQGVDYANQRINLRRVWVDNKVVERMKTEQSEAPATISPTLAEVLKSWRQQTAYSRPSDWIFASSRLKGRQPRTASILAADHLRPAAITAGVVLKPGQRFGFHNLRHSLATFLIN